MDSDHFYFEFVRLAWPPNIWKTTSKPVKMFQFDIFDSAHFFHSEILCLKFGFFRHWENLSLTSWNDLKILLQTKTDCWFGFAENTLKTFSSVDFIFSFNLSYETENSAAHRATDYDDHAWENWIGVWWRAGSSGKQSKGWLFSFRSKGLQRANCHRLAIVPSTGERTLASGDSWGCFIPS